MDEQKLLQRITINPHIFGGNPLIRGPFGGGALLAAGDSLDTVLEGYPWLESADIQACLVYARRLVGHERVEPLIIDSAG